MASAGFSLDVADQGELGVSLMAAHDYHLILLGPNPPRIAGGGDLVASLRISRIDRPIRILSIAALPGAHDATLHITPLP